MKSETFFLRKNLTSELGRAAGLEERPELGDVRHGRELLDEHVVAGGRRLRLTSFGRLQRA